MSPKIEICVDNFESVSSAFQAGAQRIELCSSLKEGGLTPSLGFLKYVKQNFDGFSVFPMIRPRGGDFCYSANELKIMAEDIKQMKSAGADGFVFGCLLPNGSIDINSNKLLLDQAKPFPSTFHRAFDMVANIEQSLEDVINLGFARILTSGGHKTALEGIEVIKKLNQLAKNRIIVMPGSGINPQNLAEILEVTKAKEFHCSASTMRQSIMIHRNDTVYMGSNSSEFTLKVSDPKLIKDMIEIAERL